MGRHRISKSSRAVCVTCNLEITDTCADWRQANLHTAVTQHSTTLRVEAIATRETTVNLAAWVSRHPGTVVYRGKSAVMLRSVVRSLLEARTLVWWGALEEQSYGRTAGSGFFRLRQVWSACRPSTQRSALYIHFWKEKKVVLICLEAQDCSNGTAKELLPKHCGHQK